MAKRFRTIYQGITVPPYSNIPESFKFHSIPAMSPKNAIRRPREGDPVIYGETTPNFPHLLSLTTFLGKIRLQLLHREDDPVLKSEEGLYSALIGWNLAHPWPPN
jgi:hypothetical protein